MQTSQAQGLRCFDLFAQHVSFQKEKDPARYYAEVIDSLNTKYNRFLFQKNISDILDPDLENASILQATQARLRAHRLRKNLIKLHEFDQYLNSKADLKDDLYALEKLSAALEKITFLTDDTVTYWMDPFEKAQYRQAQHSLFAGGLARFLFSKESPPPPGVAKKILNGVLVPFKEKYLRWTYALAYMPKLNGSIIPFEIIEKVVIEGYDQKHELLKPYLVKTRAKASFNVLSAVYNVVLAGALAMNAGQLSHKVYNDVYVPGVEKAVTMVSTLLHDAEKLEKIDFKTLTQDRAFEITLERFEARKGRKPSPEEMDYLLEKYLAKKQAQSEL